jgi:lysophospholipase L1-like esterase
VLALRAVVAADEATVVASRESALAIDAADARFRYEGRFDLTDPHAPVVIWQASRIRIDFEGNTLGLRFSDVKGQNFFDAEIDGRTSIVDVCEGSPVRGAAFAGLGAGRHALVVFKRSEAAAGTVRFTGVELAAGAQAFAPATPPHDRVFLFIGDSITVGACNEDGPADQWDDRRTHNNARSYGAFTAAAFNADYRNIAVSGMGIAIGWVEMKAGKIWDRVYPDEASPRADLTRWTPDIVFVNLGENDNSYPSAKHLPFPAKAYTDGYVALVRDIHRAWPAAHIVILRGGMFGGAQSELLREAWQPAVTALEKEDPRHTSHFVFTHWAKTHPRVADHRAMADELIGWLQRQDFVESKTKR